MRQSPTRLYKQLLAFFSCAFAFICMLTLSFFKWGDLIVDTGREIYAPLRIYLGAAIYRDFYYIYGPFPPLFNAALFSMFGARLAALILGGVIAAAVAAFLVWRVARLFLGLFSSTLACLTFIIVFAFGQYVYYANYNFILPYSYGASHSLIFALAALYFFDAWLKTRRGSAITAGLFITLALLSKIEVGGSILIAASLSGALAKKPRLKAPLIFGALPLAAFASAYLILGVPLADLITAVSPGASMPGWLSGADHFNANAVIIAKSFAYYALLAIFLALGSLIAGKLGRTFLSFIIGAAFIGAAAYFTARFFPFDWQYRATPLILILGIAAALSKRGRFYPKAIETSPFTLFCLGTLSLLLLLRVFFFVRPGHYGFYLLVPGMIFYCIFFLDMLPRRLPAAAAKNLFKLGFIAVFIVFIIGHLNLTRYCYREKSLETKTPVGTIYSFYNTREENLRRLIEYLRAETAPGSTLAVFPEGVMINFMAERYNPLYHNMYMPLDLNKPAVTARVIDELEKYKIDYVVLAHRLGDEQGFPVFGLDYGQPVWDYIKQNYELVAQFGPFPFTTAEFGCALFIRSIRRRF